MNRILGFLVLILAAGAAAAAVTGIAQVPLLNITGTGNVRPNLMLLYDNSGSMAWNYTPDNVADSSTCRARATLAGGTRACTPGHPPFNSSDFNHQYYNPAVSYTPPVKSDGTSYASQTRAATSNWTAVSTDGFGVNKTEMNGNSASTTNLATGFPDLRWCDSGGNCGYNSATYSYPDNSKTTPQVVSSNPYYYTINVAEYCTDSTLKVCQTTTVGAAAPSGYPVPARLRWCDSTALTNCQAKYIENQFIYPRFSNPNGGVVAGYGTITIGASATANGLPVNSVSVTGPSGATVISNGTVTAASGTNTATRQATLATDLALSIINKSGLSRQYAACVRVPTGANSSSVPACSSYGITLGTSNVVAVIPLDCVTGSTGKSSGVCSVLTDNSQSGWTLSVDAPSTTAVAAQPSTALISVSGTTSNNKTAQLSSITLGGVQLLPSTLSFNSSTSSSGVASAIVNAIRTQGSVTAYVGGNGVSSACAGAGSSTVCLVNTASNAGGQGVQVGSLSNNAGAGGSGKNGSVVFGTTSASVATAAVVDGIPVATTPLGAGAAVFVRTDIVPGVTSYPKAASRGDCAGSSCTYDEEMTNFANWYAYYKTRNQMMKTAVGQAFQPLNANYNVGIVSLSNAAAQGAMTLPRQFSGSTRVNWYASLYGMSTSGATPMRQALHAVGLMYANQAPYVQASGSEVVQYPCQLNFTFITTDGYWNGGAANDVANNDNVENAARFCTKAAGCVDPRAQNAESLADVALYWYNGGSNTAVSSLRSGLEDWTRPGLVPARSGENTRLHMNTYALGLGVDGIMNYEPKYDTAPLAGGDFYRLITGASSGCPWNNNGAYVWPDPATGDSSGGASYQSRVDDLWHASINGHGKYFSAADPTSVVNSLSSALSNIQVRLGAAAAAATSTPNISLEDNDIFSATFTTVRWYGEVTDRKIDPVTGEVGSAIAWSSSNTLGAQAALDANGNDGRTIYMLDTVAGGLKSFQYAQMTAAEQAWFSGKCSQLPQCPNLSSADRATVDSGATIVNWLRGQQTYADGNLLRAYTPGTATGNAAPLPIVLGDVTSAKPAYQRDPRKGYTFGAYDAFRAANAGRKPAVFVAANDGMLHAFDAANGNEMWAYAPRITMKKLYLQASTTYGTNHQFTTDGSPELGDVQINGQWRSVLVAGLNGGGRGYYALDVTDPANPKALWESCADPAVCGGANLVPNLGLSFGNPQFGTWKDSGGASHWVVFLSSGYNNVPGADGVNSGDGHGWLFVVDVATGQVLSSTSTGATVGDTGTPSGFARITAITANPSADPLVTYVYGGDNLGNMWRFDFSNPGAAPAPLLMGSAGSSQPVTSRPEVTLCAVIGTDAQNNSSTSAQKVVVFGTGRLLDVPDLTNTAQQSVYVLKDSGSGIATIDWRAAAKMADRQLGKTSGAGGDTYTIAGPAVDLGTQLGWYVDLDQNTGERVNLDPKVVSGTLNVVSNIPTSSSACSVGGTSNVYQLDVCTGVGLAADNSGAAAGTVAGHTLSNTSAAVGYIIVRLPSGALKMITTTADGSTITSSVAPARSIEAHRAGWRRVRD
jgi:type IV pilus assembly protein PilY1